jgi:hypothetical protein
MTEPQKPRGSPTWLNVLLIVVAVLVIGFGVCVVTLSGSF